MKKNLNPNYSQWNNPKTKAVRVPEYLVPVLISIAKCLDSDRNSLIELLSLESKITDIKEKINNKVSGYRKNSATKLIKDINNLINL